MGITNGKSFTKMMYPNTFKKQLYYHNSLTTIIWIQTKSILSLAVAALYQNQQALGIATSIIYATMVLGNVYSNISIKLSSDHLSSVHTNYSMQLNEMAIALHVPNVVAID